ncbi:unnamed protein product [Anisakis simplex]|uniref:purine-nucleoside phosphorylase n=1 Tax=Anisakis simplex TaxID=6269 RepID=A0A0M3K5X6_ANISI|nr:unnamed protein product [Anisakis simplex]
MSTCCPAKSDQINKILRIRPIRKIQTCSFSLRFDPSGLERADEKQSSEYIRDMINNMIAESVLTLAEEFRNELFPLVTSMISAKTFSPQCYEDLEKVANAIKSKVNLKETPTLAIICGSGLGDLAESVTDKQILPYSEIPGFPSTKVVGHKGNLVFGYLGGKYVMCVQGRFHPYEHGMNLALGAMPVRIMHFLGVTKLVVSNAAGGLNEHFKQGDIMVIKDQLCLPALAGFSPFVGAHDERFGARFPSMHAAYDPPLRKKAMEIAKQQGIRAFEGVYCMCAGPQYESPAEVNFRNVNLSRSGCGKTTWNDGVWHFSNHQYVCCFTIANMDSDSTAEVAHTEVLDTAKEASSRVCNFVAEVIKIM